MVAHWDAEGCGLSGARLGDAYHVPPLETYGDRLPLDGGGLGVTEGLSDGGDQGGVKDGVRLLEGAERVRSPTPPNPDVEVLPDNAPVTNGHLRKGLGVDSF
jgi:hypothetical protein